MMRDEISLCFEKKSLPFLARASRSNMFLLCIVSLVGPKRKKIPRNRREKREKK